MQTYVPEELPDLALLGQTVGKGKNKVHVKEPVLYHSPFTEVARFIKGST